jgi:hypothetical protein
MPPVAPSALARTTWLASASCTAILAQTAARATILRSFGWLARIVTTVMSAHVLQMCVVAMHARLHAFAHSDTVTALQPAHLNRHKFIRNHMCPQCPPHSVLSARASGGSASCLHFKKDASDETTINTMRYNNHHLSLARFALRTLSSVRSTLHPLSLIISLSLFIIVTHTHTHTHAHTHTHTHTHTHI